MDEAKMFLKFKLSNFMAILEEQEVSFTTYSYSKDIKHINNVACLVGANGSGKTSLLKGFLLFLCFSIKSYLPEYRSVFRITPHFAAYDKPSTFIVEWQHNDNRYTYELSISNQTVLYERLRKLSEKNSYRTVFVRNNSKFRLYEMKVSKQDQTRISDKATLLSFLFEYGYIKNYQDGMLEPFEKILSNIMLGSGGALENSEMIFLNDIKEKLKDNELYSALKRELEVVDTGIKDIVFQKTMFQKLNNSTHEVLEEKEMDALYSIHSSKGVNYHLPIFCESDGTKNYIALFIRLYGVLRRGGLLIADELEKSLHIDLVERILNLFMNPVTNKNNAQIIFSTHNPWFLQYLAKSQIFIVEKNNDSSTEVTRLDDVEGVRNDENFFIKYVNGAYDGKPKIKD